MADYGELAEEIHKSVHAHSRNWVEKHNNFDAANIV